MGETQNDEDAPPTEEEIKELWRKNRLNVWRHEDFHRGRTIHVAFHRKPLMLPEYWNKPVPTTTKVLAVAFSMTVKRSMSVTATEIHGNGVLVERTTKEGW